MHGFRSKRSLLAAAAIAGLLAPGLAAAQEAPTTLGEIVVTAQRRSESLQEVPAAVSALSSQDIEARGITNVEALQFVAPSLTVGTQIGVTSISIRGVGLNQRQGSPGVGIYVDGVYQPRPALGDITQVDLERVEVLRGPQGTLYGRNTSGGAVNFISNRPSQELGGYVLGGVRTYEEYRLQGAANVPLSGTWAARAVVNYEDRNEGFVKNAIAGQPDFNAGEVVSGRLRIAGEVADGVKLDLQYSGQQSQGPLDYYSLSNPPPPFAIAVTPALAGATVTTDKFRSTANQSSNSYRQYQVYAATLTWASPLGELKSITSYQYYHDKAKFDGDGLNVPFIIGEYRNTTKTYIQELLLNTRVGPMDTVAGVFLMRDRAGASNGGTFPLGFAVLPPAGQLDVQQQKYLTRSWAAYMDGTWRLTPRLRLIGGMRYSVDEQDVVSGSLLSLVTPTALIPLAALCPIHTDDQKFHAFTPRGGAQYDFSDDVNVYGTVARGFKAGGVNVAACGSRYAPEKITAYELGLKSRLLDRRLVLNATAFYYDYSDLQIEQLIGLQAQITNAAAATIKGAEVEALYAPSARWMFNANVSYLDATYDHFVNVDTLNPLAGLQMLDGNRLNNSPKWSINAGAAYTTDRADWGALQARVDLSYRTRVYFRPFNEPLDSQAAYALVNVALLWTAPGEDYSVRLFANNLTNRGYRLLEGSADSVGARYVAWGTPRQVGVELRANF